MDDFKPGDRRVVSVAKSCVLFEGNHRHANTLTVHYLTDEQKLLDVVRGERAYFFITKVPDVLVGIQVIEMLAERYPLNHDYSLWKVVEE